MVRSENFVRLQDARVVQICGPEDVPDTQMVPCCRAPLQYVSGVWCRVKGSLARKQRAKYMTIHSGFYDAWTSLKDLVWLVPSTDPPYQIGSPHAPQFGAL